MVLAPAAKLYGKIQGATCCAKTVSESHLFQLPGFPFERKQIPQIVVIVRIQRKTMEPLKQTTVPWAQGTALLSYL